MKLKQAWQLVYVFYKLSQVRTVTGKLNGDLCAINNSQQNVLLAPDTFIRNASTVC